MKMSKEKLKISMTILLIIILITILGICIYINKKSIINRLTNENKTLKKEENNSELYNITNSTIDTSKWDLEKVNIVYDTNEVPVPVPKGFVASNVNGERTVNTGFVIYEGEEPVTGLTNEVIGTYSTDTNSAWVASCTRNQFVWIPVPDSSRIYEKDNTGRAKAKLYDFTETGRTSIINENREPGVLENADNEKYFSENKIQGMTKDTFLEELETRYEETIASIEKYGGFYIGRYETGDLGKRVPVVKRMNEDISRVTWYEMYTKMIEMSENENIQTSMMWGSLWDETLQWIIDTGAKSQEEIATDSSGWGNYNSVEFEYTTINGSYETKGNGYGEKIPTGSTERNKANNIYDMAGNVAEWLIEGNRDKRRFLRGGNYDINSTHKACYRANSDPFYPIPNTTSYIRGSRVYIYIK